MKRTFVLTAECNPSIGGKWIAAAIESALSEDPTAELARNVSPNTVRVRLWKKPAPLAAK